MQRTIECPLCYNFYDTKVRIPKTLSCGHSSCSPCLSSLLRVVYINCPICRTVSLILNGDVQQLPTNFTALECLENACEECKNQVGSHRCSHCSRKLCDQCKATHPTETETVSVSTLKNKLLSLKQAMMKLQDKCNDDTTLTRLHSQGNKTKSEISQSYEETLEQIRNQQKVQISEVTLYLNNEKDRQLLFRQKANQFLNDERMFLDKSLADLSFTEVNEKDCQKIQNVCSQKVNELEELLKEEPVMPDISFHQCHVDFQSLLPMCGRVKITKSGPLEQNTPHKDDAKPYKSIEVKQSSMAPVTQDSKLGKRKLPSPVTTSKQTRVIPPMFLSPTIRKLLAETSSSNNESSPDPVSSTNAPSKTDTYVTVASLSHTDHNYVSETALTASPVQSPSPSPQNPRSVQSPSATQNPRSVQSPLSSTHIPISTQTPSVPQNPRSIPCPSATQNPRSVQSPLSATQKPRSVQPPSSATQNPMPVRSSSSMAVLLQSPCISVPSTMLLHTKHTQNMAPVMPSPDVPKSRYLNVLAPSIMKRLAIAGLPKPIASSTAAEPSKPHGLTTLSHRTPSSSGTPPCYTTSNPHKSEGTALTKSSSTILKQPITASLQSEKHKHVPNYASSRFKAMNGHEGCGSGMFDFPWGIAISKSTDLVAVTDQNNHRIHILLITNLKFISTFGHKGHNNGEFNLPRGVAISPSNNIYICDSGNHRIQVTDEKGKFIFTFGKHGSKKGKFDSPNGLAMDSKGLCYVCDGGNSRIQIMMNNGDFVRSIDIRGNHQEMFKPFFISVSDKGKIAISELCGHVYILTIQESKCNYKIISNKQPPHNIDAAGVVIDNHDNMILTDCTGGRLVVMKEDEDVVCTIGTMGKRAGELDQPHGLALTPGGDIIVCDTENNRIHMFAVGKL